MILDSVSVVVEYTKKLHTDGTFYHDARFLPEHVYHGQGAAVDADMARLAAEELDSLHKTPDRYHKAVRMDVEDALAEKLI